MHFDSISKEQENIVVDGNLKIYRGLQVLKGAFKANFLKFSSICS